MVASRAAKVRHGLAGLRPHTQTVPINTAAVAIAVGILANSVLKTTIALIFGARQSRIVVAGALRS